MQKSQNQRKRPQSASKNPLLKRILDDSFFLPTDNEPNPISAKIYTAIEEHVNSYKGKYDFFASLNDVN